MRIGHLGLALLLVQGAMQVHYGEQTIVYEPGMTGEQSYFKAMEIVTSDPRIADVGIFEGNGQLVIRTPGFEFSAESVFQMYSRAYNYIPNVTRPPIVKVGQEVYRLNPQLIASHFNFEDWVPMYYQSLGRFAPTTQKSFAVYFDKNKFWGVVFTTHKQNDLTENSLMVKCIEAIISITG